MALTAARQAKLNPELVRHHPALFYREVIIDPKRYANRCNVENNKIGSSEIALNTAWKALCPLSPVVEQNKIEG